MGRPAGNTLPSYAWVTTGSPGRTAVPARTGWNDSSWAPLPLTMPGALPWARVAATPLEGSVTSSTVA
jgi:hypothetical protein